jgi:flagellar biogenesis protein FliO
MSPLCGSLLLLIALLAGPPDREPPPAGTPAHAAPAPPGSPAQPAPAPAGTPAPAAGSIGSLLAEPLPDLAESGPSPGGMLFKMLGWVAVVGVLALAAVRIWKRLAPAGAGSMGGGGLKVVSRAALTPRHLLYAVRVGNHRLLVVGVSGDRIAPLTEFDDPAQVLALDPSFKKELFGAAAPGGLEGPEAGRESGEEDPLSPYRREVKRLREVVRGWRGKWGRVAAAEVESPPR